MCTFQACDGSLVFINADIKVNGLRGIADFDVAENLLDAVELLGSILVMGLEVVGMMRHR